MQTSAPTVESWLHAGLTYLEVNKTWDAIGCFNEAIGLAASTNG
jgi:hypothetical protein